MRAARLRGREISLLLDGPPRLKKKERERQRDYEREEEVEM